MPRETAAARVYELLYEAWRHFPNLLTLGSRSSSIIKEVTKHMDSFPVHGSFGGIGTILRVGVSGSTERPETQTSNGIVSSNRRVTVAAFM